MPRVFLLASCLAACDPASPEAITPPAPEVAPADRPELLVDVRHLVEQSAAMHAAGRKEEAVADWERAYSIFQRHLADTLRTNDPLGTLELEYTFGQLRREVSLDRGRPKSIAGRLDQLLAARKDAFASAPTP
jgi:hypothetical protein